MVPAEIGGAKGRWEGGRGNGLAVLNGNKNKREKGGWGGKKEKMYGRPGNR